MGLHRSEVGRKVVTKHETRNRKGKIATCALLKRVHCMLFEKLSRAFHGSPAVIGSAIGVELARGAAAQQVVRLELPRRLFSWHVINALGIERAEISLFAPLLAVVQLVEQHHHAERAVERAACLRPVVCSEPAGVPWDELFRAVERIRMVRLVAPRRAHDITVDGGGRGHGGRGGWIEILDRRLAWIAEIPPAPPRGEHHAPRHGGLHERHPAGLAPSTLRSELSESGLAPCVGVGFGLIPESSAG